MWVSFIALLLTQSVSATSEQHNNNARFWRTMAANDLKAAHDILKNNSPFMIVRRDSRPFRAWLEQGYRKARTKLPKVRDFASARAVLAAYGNGFRDSHISIRPAADVDRSAERWPGFSVAWHGNGYFVAYRDNEDETAVPPIGAKLINCGQETAMQLAERRLDLYEGNLRLYGRISSAPSLLWDNGNPFALPLPTQCQFEKNGKVQLYRLQYRPVTKAVLEGVDKTLDLAQSKLGIEKIDGVYWIGVPRLYGDGFDTFFADIEQRLPELRMAKTIVIDARGNGGGDSGYSDKLAQLLWGEQFVTAHAPRLGPIVYRATKVNRDVYKAYAESAMKSGSLERAKSLNSIVTKFDRAIAAGHPTFVQPNDEEASAGSRQVINPMRGRVVFLTDPICTSACLDMADLFLAMPNVIHAGTETNADTIFMDITRVPLPSGRFSIGFGHKAWIARPRASNQTYRPKAEWTYHGDLSNDVGWRDWLNKRLNHG